MLLPAASGRILDERRISAGWQRMAGVQNDRQLWRVTLSGPSQARGCALGSLLGALVPTRSRRGSVWRCGGDLRGLVRSAGQRPSHPTGALQQRAAVANHRPGCF